ncbi:MAG TPA: DNA-3-methyladenine glycosylase I [Cytophagales bacterium]|nr:DNA-3-methyladenine glycosylase I [Cytophagales bacterium]
MEELIRCPWAEKGDKDYIKYHDEEWGVPVHNDQKHFEFLILESAQAGLSWSTVLKKREGYRRAFSDFDVEKVALFTPEKIEELVLNPEIIRNRAKIAAAVNNAVQFIKVQKEFGSFDRYVWSFVQNKSIVNTWNTSKQIPATSPESDALSRDLKLRGFKFLGSTVIYAHMQATGLINDHMPNCFRYKELT